MDILMARFACKSSSTLSHCLSVINLAIQRNSKKEQEETRRLRITHRVSLVSKTTEGERLPQILLFAISSLGFVGLALLSAVWPLTRSHGWISGWITEARELDWTFGWRSKVNRGLCWRSQEDSTKVGSLAISSTLAASFLPSLTQTKHIISLEGN